ncbi:MAG: class I tRNA ligase family protein, partial [Acidimicrobiia bacterium]|nr:class I tRNA ligase family protein [Acidimicrobiia bacterium]MDX2466542.1 class I tRNA ligase family protein [Acidimicrobiia bacterium]
ALMTLRNAMLDALKKRQAAAAAWTEALEALLKMLAPIAPHVTEELWHHLGHDDSVHTQSWPQADAAAATEDVVTMVIQINGKVRDRLEVPADISEEDATAAAMATEKIQAWLESGEVRKVIARPPKLVNIVVG